METLASHRDKKDDCNIHIDLMNGLTQLLEREGHYQLDIFCQPIGNVIFGLDSMELHDQREVNEASKRFALLMHELDLNSGNYKDIAFSDIFRKWMLHVEKDRVKKFLQSYIELFGGRLFSIVSDANEFNLNLLRYIKDSIDSLVKALGMYESVSGLSLKRYIEECYILDLVIYINEYRNLSYDKKKIYKDSLKSRLLQFAHSMIAIGLIISADNLKK